MFTSNFFASCRIQLPVPKLNLAKSPLILAIWQALAIPNSGCQVLQNGTSLRRLQETRGSGHNAQYTQ